MVNSISRGTCGNGLVVSHFGAEERCCLSSRKQPSRVSFWIPDASPPVFLETSVFRTPVIVQTHVETTIREWVEELPRVRQKPTRNRTTPAHSVQSNGAGEIDDWTGADAPCATPVRAWCGL